MTTSYPDAIDDYNDPTKWNPQPTHDGTGEHSNAYSAIIAIEETIGTTGNFNFGSGGALPAWFQSGVGSPVGVVTPNTVGGLYFDTSGASGLWIATSLLSSDWVQAGGPEGAAGGLSFGNLGAGLISVFLSAFGAGAEVALYSGSGTTIFAVNDTFVQIVMNNSANVCSMFLSTGNPNSAIAALEIGDCCIDTATPGMWIATAADDAHWIQFGGILPTSASGLVTGSFWNNSGVVNVA